MTIVKSRLGVAGQMSTASVCASHSVSLILISARSPLVIAPATVPSVRSSPNGMTSISASVEEERRKRSNEKDLQTGEQ